MLYKTEFVNESKFELDKIFAETNSLLQADLLNVGLALKHIIDNKNKYGIEFFNGFEKVFNDKDYKQIRKKEKHWRDKYTFEKVEIYVLTSNIEVFENLYYSVRAYDNILTRRLFARIIELQKNHLISVTMPDDILLEWKNESVRKYA